MTKMLLYELTNAYLTAENKFLTMQYAKLSSTTKIMSVEEIVVPYEDSIITTINNECKTAIRDATVT